MTPTPTPLTETAERVAAFEVKLQEADYYVALAAYGKPRSRRPNRKDILCADLRALLAERAALAESSNQIARLRDACSRQNNEISQTLGKALGYPWFKDDPKNFPGATEADGVCVGDHVAESLADETAKRLAVLAEERGRLAGALEAEETVEVVASKLTLPPIMIRAVLTALLERAREGT